MPDIASRPHSAITVNQLIASGMQPLLARIYAARDILDIAQLNTALPGLLSYTLLKNAQEMAVILAGAIAAQRKITIVADYDVDGATACAVGLRGLRAMGAKVTFIVPNRFEYGYGLTPEIVRLVAGTGGVNFSSSPELRELPTFGEASHPDKPDFILTVDNGISSVEGVAEANRLGIEVLITDHHLPGDALPDARCIVNPNQHGCAFLSKNLAGVGVMFYVLLALRAELRARGQFNEITQPNLAELLDIVALGTVADVVRLDENNRILVQQGLQRIRAGRACAGIQALLAVARKVPDKTSAYELGFVVGPRLNAAGRLDDISLGIQCLTTDDPALAAKIASRLDALNHERRTIEADMQQTALSALENIDPTSYYSLTLFDPSWHQGVIGILASRLKDKYHRPTIIFARSTVGELEGGELKGSGRSIAGLHLRDALDLIAKRHPHLLQKFGGHAMAAGLSLREEHFAEFQQAFEAVVQSLLPPAALHRTLETDGELTHTDFSLDIARSLEQQVWGQGFPPPTFNNKFTVKSQRVVGEKHLKLKLAMGSATFDAIYFFNIDTLPENIRAVYKLSANEYNGNTTIQLVIEHWEAL
ncbi:MAG: DHH family phosphoesterase [Candidatus Nitrotoga sp.]